MSTDYVQTLTNKQYIESVLSRFSVSTSEIAIIFAENETLNPNDRFDKIGCKTALYNSFNNWVPMYETRTEGDMTIKWNWNGLKAFASSLAKELGREDPFAEKKPTVKSVNFFG